MDEIKYTGIRIGFDFCSGGVWGILPINKACGLGLEKGLGICLDGGREQGISDKLAEAIKAWNDAFDHAVTLVHSADSYLVSKEVADAFKPSGILLAKQVKKELPEMDVSYYHYVDGGEHEIIEIK